MSLCAAAAFGIGVAAPAHADVIEGNFSGTVSDSYFLISDGNGTAVQSRPGPVSVGSPVTGTFMYDTFGAIDSNGSASQGDYAGITGQLTITAGSNFTSAGTVTIRVLNSSNDGLRISDFDSPPNTFQNGQMRLDALFSSLVLATDVLPASLSVSSFSSGQNFVNTGFSVNPSTATAGTVLGSHFDFQLGSLSASVVPEPTAIGVIAVGTLILMRRRSRPVVG